MGLFDSKSNTSTKATETGQQAGKDALNVTLDAYKSSVQNDIRLDNSLTQIDESDNSITNIDNSIRDDSVINIDSSISDDSVTNIDNSVDDYDYSVANTDNSIDNSDNRVITYATDFGAIYGGLGLAGDSLEFAENIFDEALEEITSANQSSEVKSLGSILDFSTNVFYLLGVIAIAAAGAYAFKGRL